MTQKVEPGKEYEFYLKAMKTVPRAGGTRLRMTWTAVDVDGCEVTEFPLLHPDSTPGPRIIELMERLNGAPFPPGATPDWQQFIKRGMHLWAHLHRHWTEEKTDRIKLEFVYETIRGEPSSPTTDDLAPYRVKVMFRVRQSETLAEARQRLGADGPAFVTALEKMVKLGEVKLK